MFISLNSCLTFLLILGVNAEYSNVALSTTPSPIENIFINDNRNYTWNSINYPNSYPLVNQNLSITVGNGYSVLITVNYLNLDSDSGDFLIIKAGSTLYNNNNGKVFVYNLKKPRKYLIHSENVVLSFQVFGENKSGKNGFSLDFHRAGEEVTTTTENPSTKITWPTPSASDSIYHTAYLEGKSQDDYKNNETLNSLKLALAEMAIQYCATENILLKEKITVNNVHIYLLIECPYNWPNAKMCVKMCFALPVILDDSAHMEYQLNATNLDKMWNKYAKLYLEKNNFYIYRIPNNKMSVIAWLAIICIASLMFIVILYLIKIVSRVLFPLRGPKRRSSDTTNIISDDSRISKLSLGPHPLQVTPPFFDNDYAFDQYEPEIRMPKAHPVSSMDNEYQSEDDSDIEIIFNNFNKNHNNFVKSNINESST